MMAFTAYAPTLPTSAGWSSLIGIITAIIGNILISFALNTQRYAHVRIEREQNENQTALRKQSSAVHYGTIQRRIADERASKNAKAPSPSHHQYGTRFDSEETDETDALIPKLHKSTDRSTSYESSVNSSNDDTPRPSSPTDDHSSQKKSYLRSPYWWLGITLMTLGETGNFLAYGFAPASIVSPLGVVALISNCLIAPLLLHERFRIRDALGVLIAVGGAVTVVLSAQGSNPKLGADEIWELIKRWEFLTYLGITLVCMLILIYASNTHWAEKTLAIDIGLVGLFGGYTALSTKGIASLLSYRLWRVFTFPITYLLVLILASTAIMQIKYVNRALQRFDSTQVIPAQFVSFTISVIVGSAVLYRDFESTTAAKAGMFVGGCALTFLGVWCLTSGRRSESGRNCDDDDDEAKRQLDVESGIDLVDDEEGTSTAESSSAATPATPKANRTSASASSMAQSSMSADSPASFATASTSLPRTPQFASAPRIKQTISSPVLPRHSQNNSTTTLSSSPSPPSSATPTGSPSRKRSHHSLHPPQSSKLQPQTPHSQSSTSLTLPHSHPFSTPSAPTSNSTYNTPLTTSRPHQQPRSLSRFPTPGPFTSPLSSGLSVVVADQRGRLRRGSSNNNGNSGRGNPGIRPTGGTPSGSASQRATPGNSKRNSAADVLALGTTPASASASGAASGIQVTSTPRPSVGRGSTVEVATANASASASKSNAGGRRVEGAGLDSRRTSDAESGTAT